MRGSRDPSGAEPGTGEGERDGEMDGKDAGGTVDEEGGGQVFMLLRKSGGVQPHARSRSGGR
jgi:hypothetical protein